MRKLCVLLASSAALFCALSVVTPTSFAAAIEEVVVTAQRRVEDTMTVPIAVDSFSAQDILNRGATDIGEGGGPDTGPTRGESSTEPGVGNR